LLKRILWVDVPQGGSDDLARVGIRDLLPVTCWVREIHSVITKRYCEQRLGSVAADEGIGETEDRLVGVFVGFPFAVDKFLEIGGRSNVF